MLTKEKLKRYNNVDLGKNPSGGQMQEWVQEDDKRLKDFHEEALLKHIEQTSQRNMGKEENMLSKPTVYIDDMLLNVEQRIIVQCKAFDPYDANSDIMPPNREDRMIGIFDRLQMSLMEEIMVTCRSEMYIREAVQAFMSRENLTERRGDSLVTHYLSALSEHLVKNLTRVVDFRLLERTTMPMFLA